MSSRLDRTDPQRENVFQNFKFNRRTARLSLIWGALVPFGTYLLLSNNDVGAELFCDPEGTLTPAQTRLPR
jgi:hypothetical protein